MPDEQQSTPPKVPNAAYTIGRVLMYIVYAILVVIEVVLLIRIVLLLFVANLATPFAQYIYQTSNNLMTPFNGIFPSQNLQHFGYVDFSAIFAVVVYLIALFLVQTVLRYLNTRARR